VITGPRGELPETFATVEYPEGDCALFAAKRLDESWCVFDLEGTPLLQVDDAWWLYVNNDGSLALAGLKEEDQQRNTANLYTLYHIQR